MKILAVFFLSGFFLFFPAAGVVPLYAQHYGGVLVSREQQYAYDASGIKSDEQHAIENLEKSNNDLEIKIHDLHVVLISNDDLETDILDLRDKLKQTELDLHTAETKIESLENSYDMLNHLVTALTARRPVSKPKAAASKPKAPVNKPKPAVDSLKDR